MISPQNYNYYESLAFVVTSELSHGVIMLLFDWDRLGALIRSKFPQPLVLLINFQHVTSRVRVDYSIARKFISVNWPEATIHLCHRLMTESEKMVYKGDCTWLKHTPNLTPKTFEDPRIFVSSTKFSISFSGRLLIITLTLYLLRIPIVMLHYLKFYLVVYNY